VCWRVCFRDKKLSSDVYDGDDEQTEAAAAAELESSSDIDDQSSIDAVMLKALQPADGDTMQPGM